MNRWKLQLQTPLQPWAWLPPRYSLSAHPPSLQPLWPFPTSQGFISTALQQPFPSACCTDPAPSTHQGFRLPDSRDCSHLYPNDISGRPVLVPLRTPFFLYSSSPGTRCLLPAMILPWHTLMLSQLLPFASLCSPSPSPPSSANTSSRQFHTSLQVVASWTPRAP